MSETRRPYSRDSAAIYRLQQRVRDDTDVDELTWRAVLYIWARTWGASIAYLAGWALIAVWVHIYYPSFLFLFYGIALIVTGILLGWTEE